MTITELIGPPHAPDGVEPGRPPALELPAHDEGLGELAALIGVVPGFGPPLALLGGPLVLFALALAGPLLFLLTLVVLLVTCAVLVALAGAIVASPYLLVRRFSPGADRRAAVQFVPVESGPGRA